jgi:mRNA-degrading endonuclease RelE of RelBE toxin-antitoxin system
MPSYKIYTTEEFDKDYAKLDFSLKDQIKNEIDQLKTNPYVGKPLGYKFFREKRVINYRFYYLIYEEYVVVFVIALSDKKTQQEAIDTIKHLIPVYKDMIKKRLNL